MISRALSVSLGCALILGAYVGCGDATTDTGGGGGTMGGYHSSSGGPANNASSSGSSSGSSSSSSGSSSSSSGGSTSSSGGSTSSSGGSTSSSSGSSSGGADSGAPPQEAGAPPMTLDEALKGFASCMSLTDFTSKTANGVAAADIARAQTTQYGDCNACHNAGDGGFWASYGTVNGQNMTQMMFTETQGMPYILKWVTGTVDTNGQFKDLAPANAIQNQAILAQQCQQGTPCHPKFQLNPAVSQAITDFVTTTITKWHNNACTPSGGPSDAGLGGGG